MDEGCQGSGDGHLDTVIAEVKRIKGIDLDGYRRSTLGRRLSARMAELHCETPAAYLERLRTDPAEGNRLIDTVAINVSSFFRDPVVWEILAETAIPDIIGQKLRAGETEIRTWSAGCASGEEAYTIAIVLQGAIRDKGLNLVSHVFGTDVDGRALRDAAAAEYTRDSLKDAKLGLIDEWFDTRGNSYRVKPRLRNGVWFSNEDLASPGRVSPAESVFGTFDIVMCRNVLIYFTPRLQMEVLAKLHASLGVGGYLVLGTSETLDEKTASKVRVVDKKHRIFQKTSNMND